MGRSPSAGVTATPAHILRPHADLSLRQPVQDELPAGRVWSFRDVTERHRTELLLLDQARRDPLTNLLNHAAIEDALHGGRRRRRCGRHESRQRHLRPRGGRPGPYHRSPGALAGRRADRTLWRGRVHRRLAGIGTAGGRAILPGRHEALVARGGVRRREWLARADRRQHGLTIWPTEVRCIEDTIRVADEAMYSEKRERAITAEAAGGRIVLADDRAARMIGEIVPFPRRARCKVPCCGRGAGDGDHPDGSSRPRS
jgi:hypothetical protein